MLPDPFTIVLFIAALFAMHALEGIAVGCYLGLRDAWRYHHRNH
jgi:hypothetical protein